MISENVNKNFLKHLLIVLIVLELLFLAHYFFWSDVENALDGPYVCEDCNVIIFLVDTLRQDHLGVYGYHRNTSPFIDKFAEDSFVFTNAYSQFHSTKGSVTSLFTSLYPNIHRVYKNAGPQNPHDLKGVYLPDSYITLAELLQRNGLYTQSIFSTNQVSKLSNFDQGFDSHVYIDWSTLVNRDRDVFSYSLKDKNITDYAVEFLSNIGHNQFFLYLHYIAPHAPYYPPEPYRNLFLENYTGDLNFSKLYSQDFTHMNVSEKDRLQAIAYYDGEIRFIDDQFARLIQTLENNRILDKTLVILLSDHGEELGDHHDYYGHSRYVYNTLVQIPLIVNFPGESKMAFINTSVRMIDIMPTIMDFLNIDITHKINGISFMPVLNGEDHVDEIFTMGRRQVGLIRENHKLFALSNIDVNSKPLAQELYNLSNDQGEQNNILRSKPIIANKLLDSLNNYVPPGDLLNIS